MNSLRLQDTHAIMEHMVFIKEALRRLPKSEFTVEQRIEAMRFRVRNMEVGVWVHPFPNPNLLCVATINTGFVGNRFCHVEILVSMPGAKTSEFVFSTLKPWARNFCVDKIRLCDTVCSREKSRLITKYGMTKTAHIWTMKL